METLVVVVAADWTLDAFAEALAATHRVSRRDRERFITVTRPGADVRADAHAYVVRMDPGEDDPFEDWPRALVPAGPFTAFAVDHREPALAASIARAVLSAVDGAVDTNHGEVLAGEEFLARTGPAAPDRERRHRPGDR